jgi:transcriptional regulator of acetoin/glycerol metabolism
MSYSAKQTDHNTLFYSQKDIDQAWDNFLCSGGESKNLPVRDLIASSWERCLSQGVNPEQTVAP